MRDNYDFSDSVKNPFVGKIKGKYIVTIHYDFTECSKTREYIEKNEHFIDTDKVPEKYRRNNTSNAL